MSNKYQQVTEMGEFGLIERIQRILPTAKHQDLVLGIGDDTAVIRMDAERVLLVTCDIQVEGQHFLLKYISPYQLGRRAIAVNLSDIAAMGGQPTFALVSVGIPENFAVEAFDSMFEGMRDHLTEYSAQIIGGNISRTASGLVIDITMMGEAPADRFIRRGGAKAGDVIYVSGFPGSSGAGFHVLEKYGQDYPREFDQFMQAHLQPTARVELGKLLAQSGVVTALIDVSDSIAADLRHICELSHSGAELIRANFPIPENSTKIETLIGRSYESLALYSGEDYELLFTVKPNVPSSIIDAIQNESGVRITQIGRILPKEEGIYIIDRQHRRQVLHACGWDHFRQK